MKTLQLLIIYLLCWQPLPAQKMDPKAVPKPVQEVFIKDFPGVMADWELRNGHYIASFEHNKYAMQTVYNTRGNRLETHVMIEEKELPETARNYMEQHKSGDISEVTKIITAGDKVSFRVLAGGTYMEFDKSGRYLRSHK